MTHHHPLLNVRLIAIVLRETGITFIRGSALIQP